MGETSSPNAHVDNLGLGLVVRVCSIHEQVMETGRENAPPLRTLSAPPAVGRVAVEQECGVSLARTRSTPTPVLPRTRSVGTSLRPQDDGSYSRISLAPRAMFIEIV